MAKTQIEILMGVYEAGDHLLPQLESLAAQTHHHWALTVSDDSTTTFSRDVMQDFADRVAQPVCVTSGPKQGFAANYLKLLRAMRPGYVALSDQDDIWLPEKLSRAVAALPTNKPALYCARYCFWGGGRRRVEVPPFRREPAFCNALIENVAQGNTIVLNPAATELVRAAASQVDTVFAHDWWLYLLITGAEGEVVIDNGAPVMLYRQHADNQIGAGRSVRAQIARKRAVLRGAFRERLLMNTAALLQCRTFLSANNLELLHEFDAALSKPRFERLRRLGRLGLYRQTTLGTLGFWGAAFLGQI